MHNSLVIVLAVASATLCPCLSFLRYPTSELASLGWKRSAQVSRCFQGVPCSLDARDTISSTRYSMGKCVEANARASPRALRAAVGESDDVAVSTPPEEPAPEERKLPFFLDPNTRGGAVTVPVLTLLLPVAMYGGLTASGMDGTKAGAYVGVAYTLIASIAWVGSYFFRVATKNMTYATQLKKYEQAVIEKRFSELNEEEKDALLDEVNES